MSTYIQTDNNVLVRSDSIESIRPYETVTGDYRVVLRFGSIVSQDAALGEPMTLEDAGEYARGIAFAIAGSTIIGHRQIQNAIPFTRD